MSTAVVAAVEWAGAVPATAITTESKALRAPWGRPRALSDMHISWGWGREERGPVGGVGVERAARWLGRSCALRHSRADGTGGNRAGPLFPLRNRAASTESAAP